MLDIFYINICITNMYIKINGRKKIVTVSLLNNAMLELMTCKNKISSGSNNLKH